MVQRNEGHQTLVDPRRQSGVQAEFFLAMPNSTLQRGEVEFGGANGLLELQGGMLTQEDPRHLGFHHFDVPAPWIQDSPSGGVLQEADAGLQL